MNLTIPELSLILLIGASGSGKSTFARTHFLPTEVISSDSCRAMISDDENNLAVTKDAFELVHTIAAKRLALGKLTVIDATNVQAEARRPLVALARRYHCLPVAIVIDLPERLCVERNQQRQDRSLGAHVVRRQSADLRRSLRGLRNEGFRHIFTLSSPDEVEAAVIERQPLWNNRRDDHGPFDIIGDVHGCADELEELLTQLGYQSSSQMTLWGGQTPLYSHPEGRRVVFLGDLVDRGPRILDTLRLVKAMVESGAALCVPGNHDMKLLRWLQGREVRVSFGLEETMAELEILPATERGQIQRDLTAFLDGLVSHYVFDNGKLVVAHAGLKESMQGRGSREVRDFALYGDTTGENDEYGLPVRRDWAASYRGRAAVVYGHTPVATPQWVNNTINIDTGCVYGGRLTALRYPERDLVQVPARRTYAEPARPFLPVATAEAALTLQQQYDEALDLADLLGKRQVETRLYGRVTIREENALAALEVMSGQAVDPRWLIYLPPTISPSETGARPGLLEHPDEAFAYYRAEGVHEVLCEEKHMGSRAIVVLCKDSETVRQRFGLIGSVSGIIYTRTGRRFFDDVALEEVLLARLQQAMNSSGLWNELDTDWLILDCELMPWNVKAQELVKEQYAAVGAAARLAFPHVLSSLQAAQERGLDDIASLLERYGERNALATRYSEAYRRYCWPVNALDDLTLAPFHLLASEGAVHSDRDHLWHMQTLARLSAADPGLLKATACHLVDLNDAASQHEAVEWWEHLTSSGGEGMIVKPHQFIAPGRRGLAQPALKCRGREYLRIIYGPEYTLPQNIERLRERHLKSKRSLALREFALGIEALERFVRREPLRRVHECVFGVLALESEPIDPRL